MASQSSKYRRPDRRKVCVNDKKASIKSIESVKNRNKKQFKIVVEEI